MGGGLIISMLVMACFKVSAQTPFEKHYGRNSSNLQSFCTEFVTCQSVIPDKYSYVAVQAIKDTSVAPNVFLIRGVRIKSDGTMLTNSFDYIIKNPGDYDIFPLKIIPINNNSEYLITGYITHVNTPNFPHPFVIKVDANLNANEFKVFTDHSGFFTDVDQLSNGDFIFCGAMTNSLQINANYRLGWILRTDNSYSKQWMKYTHYYEHSPSLTRKDFDIVHDMLIIDNDTAVICGSISEQVDCDRFVGLDSTNSIAFIAKIELGTGNTIWYQSRIRNMFGARLAINDSATIIALATNADQSTFISGISLWDMQGNYISGNIFEPSQPIYSVGFNFNDSNYNCDITAHVPFIQNIYFKSDSNKLFISGKFIKTLVYETTTNNTIGYFDMPYSVVYDILTDSFKSINVYKTSQYFQTGPNFLTYNLWLDNICGTQYPPIYSASNTLPCISNCVPEEYITVTVDVATDTVLNRTGLDKVWIYSNDSYPCGYESINTKKLSIPIISLSKLMYFDNILVIPEVSDYNYSTLSPDCFIHICDQ